MQKEPSIPMRPTLRDPPTTTSNNMNKLVDKSSRVLIEISGVFPFDLFPDTVIVDETKLSIIHKVFFFSQVTFSVHLKDILSISIGSNLFFSTLTLDIIGYEKNPIPVKYLRRNDAARLRSIVMGLIGCNKEGIDLGKITDDSLSEKIEEVGKLHLAS